MAFRKVLVGFLVVMMTSPVWGGTEVVGNITSSNAATVRETKLTPGSTVFSGDAISVGMHGATRIAFANGAQAEVLGNSVVRLTKADNRIQMRVDRGQASIHTSGGKDMETLVADASIRAADSGETSAIIQALSEKHAVIAAQKGALLVTTAYDGKMYTVREGEAADLSVAPDPQQGGGAIPAGKAAPGMSGAKKRVIWTVVIVSAAVAITAYLLIRREKTPPPILLQNEISPSKLN
jgi:hypothetical protein